MSQFAAQRLTRGIQLATLATNAARPGVAAQRVDHGATNASFGECLEFDPTIGIEAVRSVDEAEHAVLHEIADVDRVGHRRRHASRESFDKWQSGDDAAILAGGNRLHTHLRSPRLFRQLRDIAIAVPTRAYVSIFPTQGAGN